MEKINLITPEDRAMFDRIDRDCLKMHVCPPPKTFINMKVHDANGSLTLDMDMPSRSWVRNAYNALAHVFLDLQYANGSATYGAGSMSGKTFDGSTISSAYKMRTHEAHSFDGVAGNANKGIILGTGTTAESFESTWLSNLIAHGNSSGQLAFNAQTNAGGSYDALTKKWTNTLSRVFNNNSGGDIAVGEVGLSGIFSVSSGGGSAFMFSRDLLPSPVTVSNAAQLTVTYTIEMTFPA